jgi:prolipoprotein diacylglyceryltransferase
MYVLGYGIGRFWVEGLRIDEADQVAGLRFNQWVAIAMIVGGAVALVIMRMYPVAEPAVGEFAPVEDVNDDVIPADDPLPSRTDGPTPASE